MQIRGGGGGCLPDDEDRHAETPARILRDTSLPPPAWPSRNTNTPSGERICNSPPPPTHTHTVRVHSASTAGCTGVRHQRAPNDENESTQPLSQARRAPLAEGKERLWVPTLLRENDGRWGGVRGGTEWKTNVKVRPPQCTPPEQKRARPECHRGVTRLALEG